MGTAIYGNPDWYGCMWFPTAILLANLVPDAAGLPSARQWIQANAALEQEVRDRREIEVNLRISEANYREQAQQPGGADFNEPLH